MASVDAFGGAYPDDEQKTATLKMAKKWAPRGVFGPSCIATPKYALNEGGRDDFRETMARLFIQVNSKELGGNNPPFPSSVRGGSKDATSYELAKVISGTALTDINNGSAGYIDFLLQNVTHAFQEKVDVAEVLSDNYVAYYFGQAAPIFNYSGILLNTKQDDQVMNMLRIYRDMTRGSQLAKRRKLLSIRYDGIIVRGTMNSLTSSLDATGEMACPFGFSLLVKKLIILPNQNANITIIDARDDLSAVDPSFEETPPANVKQQMNISPPTESTAPITYYHSPVNKMVSQITGDANNSTEANTALQINAVRTMAADVHRNKTITDATERFAFHFGSKTYVGGT